MVRTLSVFVHWVFAIIQFLGELSAFVICGILYTHNLLKNLNIVKNQHINTNNILTIRIHNKSIHSNFKTNESTRVLLNVNLLCYALVRRRQYIPVLRPFNEFTKLRRP